MNSELRQIFDNELEAVLADMPARIHELMDEIPLVVEDYPSPQVMRRMRVRHRSQLCGLYTGIPLNKRSINDWGVPSDVIHIYREGILSQATRRDGTISVPRLQKQIHITILHEYGHHHGLTERDLREMGYG
ncbi:MAG: metallopeptidase family protein [Pirellulales bacterium]